MGATIVHKDSTVSYWVNAKGTIWLAPATGMTPKSVGLNPSQWRYCEAVGAREIERISLMVSRQMWEQKKARQVSQKLREMSFMQAKQIAARLRKAQNFSAKDVVANEKAEKRWKIREEEAIRLILSEFDPTRRNTALSIEISEESTSPLKNAFKKKKGVQP